MAFTKATKKQAKLRLALIGPSGSGKTYTALSLCKYLGGTTALIDTENHSASLYADEFAFDVQELDNFHPQKYIDLIHEAENAGYDNLVIDSLSHAWMGKDGVLALVDRFTTQAMSKDAFGTGWRKATPIHNEFVDAMIRCKCNLIVTMRSKTEYVIEKDERTGKNAPRKIGLAPIQRDGLEFEFHVVGDMDLDNTFIVSKTRCKALRGAVMPNPGKQLADTLKGWLDDGAPVEVENATAPTTEEKPTPVAPQPTPATTTAPATAPASDHPNKNKITTALCGAIHTAATRMGMSGTDLHALAGKALGKDTVATLYELGPSRDPYAKLLNDLNVMWTEQQKKASGN